MIKNKTLSEVFDWLPNQNKRILPLKEAKIFFNLIDSLDLFVGKKSGIFDQVADKGKLVESSALRKQVRDYWYANHDLIDQFIQSKDGQDLTDDQKQILLGWKNRILGDFFCIKYYSNCAIFKPADVDKDDNYYAILGLTDDFEQLLQHEKPPYMVSTVLLPYKDVIVWDGLVGTYSISFGKKIREIFIKDCQLAKKENKIVSKI